MTTSTETLREAFDRLMGMATGSTPSPDGVGYADPRLNEDDLDDGGGGGGGSSGGGGSEQVEEVMDGVVVINGVRVFVEVRQVEIKGVMTTVEIINTNQNQYALLPDGTLCIVNNQDRAYVINEYMLSILDGTAIANGELETLTSSVSEPSGTFYLDKTGRLWAPYVKEDGSTGGLVPVENESLFAWSGREYEEEDYGCCRSHAEWENVMESVSTDYGTFIVDQNGYTFQPRPGYRTMRRVKTEEIFGPEGGDDTLDGSDQQDGGVKKGYTLYHYQNGDTLVVVTAYGSSGNDMLQGGLVEGKSGNDTLIGTLSDDVLDGGDDDDWLKGGGGADTLIGGAGFDIATYEDAEAGVYASLADGSAGLDKVLGIEGLHGSAFGDQFIGNANNNWMAGNGGADALSGGLGADTLGGGSGSDTLDGGLGADMLSGGADTDMLKGGGGSDYLDGGDGYDGVSFAGATGGVTINLATGQHGGYAAGVTIVNVESVQATAFADTLVARERGNGQGTDLHADGGNDTLIGSAGQEGLFGGEGDDWFDGRDGADTIHGWTGHDAIHGGDGNDSISGGAGNDWLSGGDGADWLDGGADWDTVSYLGATGGVVVDLTTNANGGAAAGDVITGVEVLQGSSHNDTLIGIDRGNGQGVQLYGEGGNDSLFGKNGGDCLFGGSGNDWLDGGLGGDILTGGEGLDYFAFATALGGGNVDWIQDFDPYADTIALNYSMFGLPGAMVTGSAFKLGTTATTAAHRIVYDRATGDLFYDADGVGGAAQVKFAVIANHAQLSNANFLVW